MSRFPLANLLATNSYPGRGIVLGRSEDGNHAYLAYFIMGRSANSRNRVFTLQQDSVLAEAADFSKLADPRLILYTPVRTMGEHTVVTNGDQTDTICTFLEKGETFEGALRTRTFEPDAPNYTPRISGLMSLCLSGFSYKLSILKSNGMGKAVRRFFFDYPEPLPGEGHFIHTYDRDGTPLPSFSGEPIPVAIPGSIDAFGESIWNALDKENKISLFVRALSLDGTQDTRIYNQYEKVE